MKERVKSDGEYMKYEKRMGVWVLRLEARADVSCALFVAANCPVPHSLKKLCCSFLNRNITSAERQPHHIAFFASPRPQPSPSYAPSCTLQPIVFDTSNNGENSQKFYDIAQFFVHLFGWCGINVCGHCQENIYSILLHNHWTLCDLRQLAHDHSATSTTTTTTTKPA